MSPGIIRIKTLNKFLSLCALCMDGNRILTIDEIMQEIHCCRGHAYNYRRALAQMYPLFQ
jgi:hypothetical protein